MSKKLQELIKESDLLKDLDYIAGMPEYRTQWEEVERTIKLGYVQEKYSLKVDEIEDIVYKIRNKGF